MDYPGKVITKNQVTPTQTNASGNWTLDDAAAATKNNTWPVALVPNPISKSLRFNSADSAYLNRTPASAGNRKTWTWSGWVKRSAFSASSIGLFGAGTASNNYCYLGFASDNKFQFQNNTSSGNQINTTSAMVFRDVSAWYHIVLAVDTTQATNSNGVKLYVNGVQQTLTFSTYTQNTDTLINNTNAHVIGDYISGGGVYFPGYLTEVNFIDGQALTPSSFGMTNPQTGQWIPIKYSGTYGTNGFYLNFKDATSTTTLGYDYSGNANNWTTNNFSVTAGSGNDSLTDVPTPWVAYNTTGDVGGVVRGNYCTWNPLAPPDTVSQATNVLNGNLQVKGYNVSFNTWAIGTTSVSSGKWYFEYLNENGSDWQRIGILLSTTGRVNPQNGTYYAYYSLTGNKLGPSVDAAYGATWTTNDVIGVAFDLDNGKIWFSKNGTWQASGDPVAGTNAAFTGLSGSFLPAAYIGSAVSNSAYANFGQRPFAYTPPAGFLSLCSTNLPTPTIGFGLTNQGDDYFNIALYTGTGSSNAQTGVGFQPDLVWIKGRSGATDHGLYDAVRGVQKQLESNTTTAETTETTGLTAFGTDGFTVGALAQLNTSSATYVAWNWKAGGTGVTNTAGTITSTVSANTTSGFSIVSFAFPSVASKTVGHGLGVAPSMVIVKSRSNGTQQWITYHASSGNTGFLILNTTNAFQTNSTVWDNTSPTSTVFTLGSVFTSGTYGADGIAYCFAAVAGYSAFGSYTGNGSADGPFVYCGFRPRFILYKRTDTTTSWVIWDTSRNTYNVTNLYLLPNSSGAEGTLDTLDILSNGFKLRTTNVDNNGSGGTFVYAAFAESPFKFANAR